MGVDEGNLLVMGVEWYELFNDWGGRGYDDSVPVKVTKTAPPGIGLHDPLHGWQASPELNSFHRGVGQICPR